MSQVQSSTAVCENEQLGVASSIAAQIETQNNGYKVDENNETNMITVVGPSTSQCIDIASDLVAASTSRNQLPGNTAPKSSENTNKKTKVKTEPANGYLQFIQARKKAGLAINPNSKVKLSELIIEWRELPEDQKAIYKQMAQKEKIGLGSNFRKNRTRKIKEVDESKPSRKERSKKSTKTKVSKNEPKIVNDISLTNLMKKYKYMDDGIKVLEEELVDLRSLKLSKSVELAVGKAKLQMKSEIVNILKEKLSNMHRLHSSCGLAK